MILIIECALPKLFKNLGFHFHIEPIHFELKIYIQLFLDEKLEKT